MIESHSNPLFPTISHQNTGKKVADSTNLRTRGSDLDSADVAGVAGVALWCWRF